MVSYKAWLRFVVISELLFVNTFGMPYNSGVYAFVIILAVSFDLGDLGDDVQDEIHPVRMKISFIPLDRIVGYSVYR